MTEIGLHAVFRAVVVSRLTYASPAWSWFITATDRQRVDSLLSRSKRCGFCPPDQLQNEAAHLDAFEMKGLRKILRVSWTAKKTNEWVLNKAGVKRDLLVTIKAKKLAYYGHTMRKQGSCLEKEIMQGTTPGARRRGRPRTAWMDNIKTWTGSPWKSVRNRGQR